MSPGFSHILGYVSSPIKDKKGVYWQTEFEGKDGLEKQYSDRIQGINGSKIVEIDALGQIQYQKCYQRTCPRRGLNYYY